MSVWLSRRPRKCFRKQGYVFFWTFYAAAAPITPPELGDRVFFRWYMSNFLGKSYSGAWLQVIQPWADPKMVKIQHFFHNFSPVSRFKLVGWAWYFTGLLYSWVTSIVSVSELYDKKIFKKAWFLGWGGRGGRGRTKWQRYLTTLKSHQNPWQSNGWSHAPE